MLSSSGLAMEPIDLVMIATAFALGAALGSFLNVCIQRMPVGESVVAPRSRCGQCRHLIRWYDNIPLLSYLVLRGRCRDCGAVFSIRYLVVELVAALVSVMLFLRFGPTLEFVGYLYFACALLAITYIDLDHQIIPDLITLPGIAVAILLSVAAAHGDVVGSLTRALTGMLLGGGILWAVAWSYHAVTRREGMGGGDVKLLAMIGAFLGWQAVLLTLLLASFIGSVIGVGTMLARGADTKLAIPFGPFLSLGALVALFCGRAIVGWYISYLGWSTISSLDIVWRVASG
jgi:leader peptidase (prepilin peptidase)/N-methyltransferase